MRGRRSPGVPRWLFYFAVGASWLFGAEIVVLTAARKSLPGRLPSVAGWLFVAAIAVSVVAMARLEMMGRQKTGDLVEQLEEALHSITALTEASLSSLELTELLDRFLERLVTVLHTEIGAIFLLSDSGTELRAIATRGIDEEQANVLVVSVSDNDGLISRAVVTESPIATDRHGDLEVLGTRTGRRLASAAACPIVIEGRLIGVCVAASSMVKAFDERELHLMQLVADRSGLGIERKRLDEAEQRSRLDAERAHRYAVVLATISASLATARVNYQQNLASLVDIVVPVFCDWCAIDILDKSSTLQRIAIRYLDDRSDLCSDELRQRVPLIDAMASRAFETGQTQKSSGFLALASARHQSATGSAVIDPTPWIAVPITTGKGVVGTMIFAYDGGTSVIDSEIVATAEDIARRAAVSIDRVLFFQETQAIAEHSSRVANQLQQLLDASLEVSRLIDDSDVISAIVGRALAICDAAVAVVTLSNGSNAGMRAIAEQGKLIRVGELTITTELVDLPDEIGSLSETSRLAGLLATPIVGANGSQVGDVAIWREDGPEFTQEDETVLVLLAQTASTALSSVELYRTIQASEARWRSVIETAPIGVMEVDVEGTVQWANRSALDIFGVRGTALNREVSDPGIGKADVPQLQRLWSRATTGVEMHDRELVGVQVGEVKKDLLVSVVPLYKSDRTVQSILTLVADISDRRRLEGELQQSQRMEAVGQLAGNVAHDFNNLLTLISGYTELLRSHKEMDERQLDLVNNIQGVADRAALLTGRLLTISRRQSSRPEVLDPVAALDSIMEVLGEILGSNVELVHEFGADGANISIDPAYFDQMILNLAVNARDAMPEGGTFTVVLQKRRVGQSEAGRLGVRSGEMIELVVSDTGTGMNTETAVHCFDPFFTTKGPSKGTGLGLAAVRGLIVECGGSIQVRSTLGVGTSFIIHLPVVASPAEAISTVHSVTKRVDDHSVTKRVDESNVTVLVAEDDDTLRSMIVKIMTQAGFRVLSAGAGDLALEVAQAWIGTIDILVTDVTMPGMNGPDLAIHIAELSPGSAVLFISSNPDGILIPASRSGQTSFLPKPFRPSQLIQRVRDMLNAQAQLIEDHSET